MIQLSRPGYGSDVQNLGDGERENYDTVARKGLDISGSYYSCGCYSDALCLVLQIRLCKRIAVVRGCWVMAS